MYTRMTFILFSIDRSGLPSSSLKPVGISRRQIIPFVLLAGSTPIQYPAGGLGIPHVMGKTLGEILRRVSSGIRGHESIIQSIVIMKELGGDAPRILFILVEDDGPPVGENRRVGPRTVSGLPGQCR